MSKHNKAKLEKDERNLIYALRFKKKKEPTNKKVAKPWSNWCRVKGHVESCNCVYPSRDEVVAASRHR